MNLKLRKILGFDDISINFSFPRRQKKSTIGEECLRGISSFHYKKINLILGSNSSGKTSLGKVIRCICDFLSSKESANITRLVPDNVSESYIEVDFVSKDNGQYFLNRAYILVKRLVENSTQFDVKMDLKQQTLREGDNYAKVCKFFTSQPTYSDYLKCLENKNFNIGWNLAMPLTEKGHDKISFEFKDEEIPEYKIILEKVLKTLDPNIKEVAKSNDSTKAFVVKYDDGKTVIVQDKQTISGLPYLSTGTKYGFPIGDILFSIKNHYNGIYYVDELFSYINSDIEVATLSTMIQLLGDDEQLFFTTHNTEIMNLNLPLHSFSFLGKEVVDGKPTIKFISASEFEKRNNVIVKNLYNNDIFGIAPSTKLLFEVGDQK